MTTSPRPAASSARPDRADAAVHHVGGRDDVGAGLRVRRAPPSASSGSVASLSTSTSPSGAVPIGPQWPWSVYSHRQTSAHSDRPGTAARNAGQRRAPRDRADPRRRGRPGASRRGCRTGSRPTRRARRARGIPRRACRRSDESNRASSQSRAARPRPRRRTAARSAARARAASRAPGAGSPRCAAAAAADAPESS